MSEYQYYEFLAIDRPLTEDEMRELRSLSSRAEVTATRFCNTYNWGDFSGSPKTLMEKYFDAHVYVTNWGVNKLMLRLPREVIRSETLDRYSAGDALTCRTTEEHLIISWLKNDDPGGEWVEGEGWMAQLAPIREEIERGDYRSLYIGWLASLYFGQMEDGNDDEDEERLSAMEPPVPAGLGSLTSAQRALVGLIGVNNALLKAASMASPAVSAAEVEESDRRMGEWVERISAEEARKFLRMLLRGEGRKAERQLRGRYREFLEFQNRSNETGTSSRRTVRDLLVLAQEAEKERKKQKALEQERKRAERERLRREYLARMAQDFAGSWKKADALAQEKNASGYDRARDLIVDLRDAYAQGGRQKEFSDLLAWFASKHTRKPALMRRLNEVGLSLP